MEKEDPSPVKQQFQSLTNLPRFFRMIWNVSPALTLWNIFFRLIQAALPLGILYAGKEIIDELGVYIKYVSTQEINLNVIEQQKEDYRNTYFSKDIKDNH